jgi:hypothetical protein
LFEGGFGVPGDLSRVSERCIKSIVHLIQQSARLVQLIRSGQGTTCSGSVIAGVVVGALAVCQMSVRELIEDLSQRPHSGDHISENGVRVGGVVEGPAGVGEAAQRF